MGVTSEKIQDLQEKAAEINLILLQPDVDLWKLRELALSEGGLVNDTLRRRAWPKLVGLHKFGDSSTTKPTSDDDTNNEASNEVPDREGGSFFANSSSASSSVSNAESNLRKQAVDVVPRPDRTTKPHSPNLLCESLDVEQIDRDVARCTWHLLSGTQRYRRFQYRNKSNSKKVANVLKRKQKRLANLINVTLVQSYEDSANETQSDSDDDNDDDSNKDQDNDDDDDVLRYFQGYHDVASVFLSTLGGGSQATSSSSPRHSQTRDPNMSPSASLQDAAARQGLDLPARVLKQISFSHFRDAMRSSFGHLQNALRLVLFPLLQRLDPEVHDHLYDCSMEPFFCLSWVLTWFSHDVRDTELVKRLFDAFVVSHPLLPLYVAIAMMLHPFNRQWILSTDCDFASLHHVLASLPRNSSAVGWKMRLGPDGFEGYVSDNEDEDQDNERFGHSRSFDGDTSTGRTASTDLEFSMTSSTADSNTYSGVSAGSVGTGDNGNSDESFDCGNDDHTLGDMSRSIGPIGCFSDPNSERVPFQHLIDLALVYMKRYPPSSLTKLADRYYSISSPSNDPADAMMFPPPSLDMVPSTTMLNAAPKWAIATSAKADWVLKQRARAKLGKKAMSRKDKRRQRRAQAQAEAKAESMMHSDNVSVYSATSGYGTFVGDSRSEYDDGNSTVVTRLIDDDYMKKYTSSRAVVASGNGGPGEDEERRLRRRKNRIWMNVAVVGVVAISVVAMIQVYRMSGSDGGLFGSASTSSSQSSSSSSAAGNGSDGSNLKKRSVSGMASAFLAGSPAPSANPSRWNKDSVGADEASILATAGGSIWALSSSVFALFFSSTEQTETTAKLQNDARDRSPQAAHAGFMFTKQSAQSGSGSCTPGDRSGRRLLRTNDVICANEAGDDTIGPSAMPTSHIDYDHSYEVSAIKQSIEDMMSTTSHLDTNMAAAIADAQKLSGASTRVSTSGYSLEEIQRMLSSAVDPLLETETPGHNPSHASATTATPKVAEKTWAHNTSQSLHGQGLHTEQPRLSTQNASHFIARTTTLGIRAARVALRGSMDTFRAGLDKALPTSHAAW